MTHRIERRICGYRVKIGDTEIKINFKTKAEAERWISKRLTWRQTYGVQNERKDEAIKTG